MVGVELGGSAESGALLLVILREVALLRGNELKIVLWNYGPGWRKMNL